MTLDLENDSAIFVADFGEALQFRLNDAGDARDVTANVNREAIADDQGPPFAGHRPGVMHVMVRNHATLGVTPDEVVNDVSEIKVDYPKGATAAWRPINRTLKQNAGCVLLEVQI